MRNTPTHWILLAYCVVLWLTNWSWSTEYESKIGVAHTSIDLRWLGAILGGIVTVICIRRAWRLIRELMDLGVRVPREQRLVGNWGMLWYLIPLGIRVVPQWHSTVIEGVVRTSEFQYGGSMASLYSLVLSASAIMLFQTVVNLESQLAKQNNSVPALEGGKPLQMEAAT